jgi:hypothetical protein
MIATEKSGMTIGGTNQQAIMHTFAFQAGGRVPLSRRCLLTFFCCDTIEVGTNGRFFKEARNKTA